MASVTATTLSKEAQQAQHAGAVLDAADKKLLSVLNKKNATQAEIMAASSEWQASTRCATATANILQSINQEKRELIRKLEVR
jgi:hypothetical protein